EEARHLQKEAFQLANYYFVFQGVILVAFYNTPSDLKCKFGWIPFVLSLLAGVLNLLALCVIMVKYIHKLNEIATQVMRDPTRNGNPGSVECERRCRFFIVAFCMCLFLAFFCVTLVGCWKVTCAATPRPPPSPAPH
ncbi:hypothetical protein MIMGU_mgv1a018659mg, partial [Erythranthe guttata]